MSRFETRRLELTRALTTSVSATRLRRSLLFVPSLNLGSRHDTLRDGKGAADYKHERATAAHVTTSALTASWILVQANGMSNGRERAILVHEAEPFCDCRRLCY